MYNLRKSPGGADTQLDRELQILAHAHKNRTLKDLNLRNVDSTKVLCYLHSFFLTVSYVTNTESVPLVF